MGNKTIKVKTLLIALSFMALLCIIKAQADKLKRLKMQCQQQQLSGNQIQLDCQVIYSN